MTISQSALPEFFYLLCIFGAAVGAVYALRMIIRAVQIINETPRQLPKRRNHT